VLPPPLLPEPLEDELLLPPLLPEPVEDELLLPELLEGAGDEAAGVDELSLLGVEAAGVEDAVELSELPGLLDE
jgi:hypothetical protein